MCFRKSLIRLPTGVGDFSLHRGFQPPTQWITRGLTLRVMPSIHVHRVPILKTCRATFYFPICLHVVYFTLVP